MFMAERTAHLAHISSLGVLLLGCATKAPAPLAVTPAPAASEAPAPPSAPTPAALQLQMTFDDPSDDGAALSFALTPVLLQRLRRSACCDNPGPYRCRRGDKLRIKLRVEADGRIAQGASPEG